LGIETVNQGGSHERKAIPMSNHSNRTSARQDVYAEITSQLVAAIEANPGRPSLPWRKSSGALFVPVNALTQNAYNGINVVSLWVAAEVKNFTSPVWATYKQWLELGAQVRKDEKSSLVIFYKEFETGPNPDDASDHGKRRVARASRVFNAFQVDGYEATIRPEPLGPIERIAAADLFVKAPACGGQCAHVLARRRVLRRRDRVWPNDIGRARFERGRLGRTSAPRR
jgi:antirestriction protein ArdC